MATVRRPTIGPTKKQVGTAAATVEGPASSRPQDPLESYPILRERLGDEGFVELARLIRTTYEATEHRRLRHPSEPAWRDTGGAG
jgi:hypothetical protein